MNCRPGDLCRIVGTHPALGLNDHFVTLRNEPPVLVGAWVLWRFEEPIHIVTPQAVHDITGHITPAGRTLVIAHMADPYLSPIRPQSDDAVDEIVARLGAAPKTLTEVREVSHG